MRKLFLLLALLLCASWSFAQSPVYLGRHRVDLEANIPQDRTRGPSARVDLGTATNGRINVLVQFMHTPTQRDRARLRSLGVELQSYVGGNMYFAQGDANLQPSDLAGTSLRAIAPVQGVWKIGELLQDGNVPEWARRGDRVEVEMKLFSNISMVEALKRCAERGYHVVGSYEPLRTVRVQLPAVALKELAEENWVRRIAPVSPEREAFNYTGRILTRVADVARPADLDGRGLTGKGVRVGIWDGNTEDHVDYGNRMTRIEQQMSVLESGGHGMHVSGTIGGAGILDPRGKGMAPRALLFNSSFGEGVNGLGEAEEMDLVRKEYGISLSSNSYGLPLWRLCNFYYDFSYNFIPLYEKIDEAAFNNPELTIIFACGNDQGSCGKKYASSLDRTKNTILVGALDKWGDMTPFSSWGPMDDGRLLPTVCTQGNKVYSTMPGQSYAEMSGTSMACPMAAGIAALVTERYHQLYGKNDPNSALVKGLLANTAYDMGNPYVDFQFGYGIVDAKAAVETLEAGQFLSDTVKADAENGVKTYDIEVPAGTKELRVMLTWIDPTPGRELKYGESALVNNLDLFVVDGKDTILPYVLNPRSPDAKAKRGVDKLNNIEQVVISDPEGKARKVTIVVQGGVERIASANGKQHFVVNWYFNKQTPELVAPAGGEMFAPGEVVMCQTRYIDVDDDNRLNIELSYDGGKTYEQVGMTRFPSFSFPIPKDAKRTKEARVRVRSADNKILVSAHNFQIAGRPENLVLNDLTCGPTTWKLTWDSVAGAKEYNVLVADIETGEFMNLGDPVTKPELTDLSGALALLTKEDKRLVLAVEAVFEGGVISQRSKGVLVKAPRAMDLANEANLPFTEYFIHEPSLYTRIELGENMKMGYKELINFVGFPQGARGLQFMCKKTVDEGAVPFESGTNELRLKSCNVKLPAIDPASGQKLLLFVQHLLKAASGAPNDVLRLQARVDNAVLKTFAGDDFIVAENEVLITGWDLTAYQGQEVSIDIICYSQEEKSQGIIINWGIEKIKPEDEDVYVDYMDRIANGNYPEPIDYSFIVTNKTMDRITNLPVRALLNGRLIKTIVIDTIAPLQDKAVTVPLQFTTDSVYGEKMKLELCIDYKKDGDPSNNALSRTFNHFGKVIAHPNTSFFYFFGMKIPQDPRIEMTLPEDGELLYADNQGLLGDYMIDQQSTIRFWPSDDAFSVIAAFDSLDLLSNDSLCIYTQHCDELYQVSRLKPKVVLKRGTDLSKLPPIISESPDGALIFKFFSKSVSDSTAAGWLARISEVRRVNTFTLVGVKGKVVKVNEEKATGVLEATVKNNSVLDQHNVLLSYDFFDVKTHIDTIPLIKAGEQVTVTLKDVDTMLSPVRDDYAVEILSSDLDKSDNSAVGSIANDRYWTGGKFTMKQPIVLSSVYLNDKSYSFVPRESEYITYPLLSNVERKALPMYITGSNRMQVYFALKTSIPFVEGTKLFVWLENDTTAKEFPTAAPFYHEAELKLGQRTVTFDIDLKGQNVKPGIYRVRFVVATDADLAAFKKGEEIMFGSAADAFVKFIDEKLPVKPDLRIIAVEGLTSGPGPKKLTPTIQIVNDGNVDIAKVRLKVWVNDGDPSYQILPGVKREDTLKATLEEIDFDKVGAYIVSFQLPSDENERGNLEQVVVARAVANKTDALYALTFKNDKKEVLEIPHPIAEETGGFDSITYEGWFYIAEMQFGTLVESKRGDLLFASTNDRMNLGIPKNALAVGHGRYIFSTKENTLMPGMWHHVAVSFSYENDYWGKELGSWTLYIDGVKQKLEVETEGWASPTKSDLKLGGEFTGQVHNFRIWNRCLTEQDLQAGMSKLYLDNPDAKDSLLCEYQINEGEGEFVTSDELGLGVVNSERINVKPEDRIWQPLKRLVSNVTYGGVDELAVEKPEGTFEVNIPADEVNSADLTKMQFTKIWNDVNITLADGNPLPATHDFAQPLKLKASAASYFGLPIDQEITVVAKSASAAAAAECDLLALTIGKDKNKGLAADVVLNNPTQDELVELKDVSADDKLDRRFVTVTLTDVSQNALVYYGDNTAIFYTKGDDIEVDFTKPVVLRVVSADEKAMKTYIIFEGKTPKAQVITWTLDPLSYKLENKKIAMKGTADSKLPVVYRSYDDNVVTFTKDGEMQIVGVGKTKVEATQPGNEEFAAATPVAFEVEITPADLKGWIEDSIQAGKPMRRLVAKYEGLLFGEHPATIKRPEVNILVKDNPPVVWDEETMAPLAKGVYKVVPVESPYPVYFDNGYNITFGEGTLKVTDPDTADYATLTVKVVDEASKPIENAEVSISGKSAFTGNDGKVDFVLKPLKGQDVYTVDVFAADYTKETFDFNFVDSADTIVEVKLLKAEIEIKYLVEGAGGQISGKTTQKVAKGGETEVVVAVPDPGYAFNEWKEDKSTAPMRKDIGAAAATFTATFKPATFVAIYRIGDGGEKVSGELEQKDIAYQGDATAVEVKPKEGNVFLGWSDGVATPARHDKKLAADIDVTAEFMKPYPVPYAQDFENPNNYERYWSVVGMDEPDMVKWRRQPIEQGKMTGGTYYWALDGSKYEGDYDTKLYSPWIAIEGLTGDLKLAFDYYFFKVHDDQNNTNARAGYQFEDNIDVDLADMPSCESFITKSFEKTIDEATRGTHKFVRFYVRLKVKQPENKCKLHIDNFLVSNDNATDVLREYSVKGAGTIVLTSKPDAKEKYIFLSAPKGTESEEVTAIPDDGYEFRGWSDDLEAAKRKDKEQVNVTAFFGKKEVAPVTLTYQATKGGYIEGPAVQILEKGAVGLQVTAKGEVGFKFVGWDDSLDLATRRDTAKADKNFVAKFEPELYTVTITVENPAHEPIKGAKVTLRGIDSVTGEDGVATFEVPITKAGESDSVIVTAENCDTVTLKDLFIAESIAKSVQLTPSFPEVKILFVDAEGKPLANVACKVDQDEFTSDSTGMVTLKNVKFGTYTITAALEHYEELVEDAEIASADTITYKLVQTLVPVTVVVINGITDAPIENAYVQVYNGSFLPTDNMGVVSTKFPYGESKYRVTCDGYDPVDKTLNVDADNVVDTVRLVGKLRVEFYASVNGKPAANVEVLVDNKEISPATAQTGLTHMMLTKGKHAFRALLDGHDPVLDTVDVASDGQKVNIEFTQTVPQKITFEVFAGKKAIEGAEVVLNDSLKLGTTDKAGKVSKDLSVGSYKYTVKVDGYADFESVLIVKREPATEVVSLAQLTYQTNFVVMISSIAPMQNATVVVDGKALPLTDAEGKASLKLPKGVYQYNVYAKGYEAKSGTVTVADSVTTEIIVFEPWAPVVVDSDPTTTFAVTLDGKKPLEGATVLIDGSIAMPLTDAQGKTERRISAGNHSYRVLLDGFVAKTGSFVVDKEDQTIKVDFASAPLFTVTIKVTEGGKPVAGVAVTLQNTQYSAKSDEKGLAVIKDVAIGNYAYYIKYNGAEYAGGFAVDNKDVEITVAMDKSSPVVSTLLAAVKLYPSPFNTIFRLEGVSAMETLRVMTVSGRLVKQIQHNGAEHLDVDGTYFAPGLYILQLVDRDGAVKTLKAIKQ